MNEQEFYEYYVRSIAIWQPEYVITQMWDKFVKPLKKEIANGYYSHQLDRIHELTHKVNALEKQLADSIPEPDKEAEFWINWLAKRIDLSPIQRQYIGFCLSELQQENRELRAEIALKINSQGK